MPPAETERVLRYLPAFLEPDRTFGQQVSAKMVGPREIESGGGRPGDVEQSFVEACYAEHLVQSSVEDITGLVDTIAG